MLVVFVSTPLPIGAERVQIKITVDEGFDGKVKRGEGFPVNVKLENNGEAFSGDLLVNFNPSYNSGGALLLPVELPEGSTKTYQLSLPGMTEDGYSYNQNTEMIQLYKGDWKKGDKVTFSGDKIIKPRFINANELVIGVLSENYDRLKELRVLPSTSAQMLPLEEEMIPKQGLGLETVDYLIIDEYAVSELDDQQQQAIKEWIQSGGVLVAGAAPDASSSYGELYSILPMKLENESFGSVDFLKSTETETIPFESINLFTGAVEKEAQVLNTSAGLPATIKKEFGNGAILQTSFSLGDQPLSTWKGYSTWFKAFIDQAGMSNTNANHYGQDLYDRMYWEFVETNEYFPASNYSIPQLIVIMLIYLVVIVPILYVVLRKLDKREHTWWIIPSIALVMSIIVFSLGAKDRIAESQLNQMGVYQVKDGTLVGLQASTLLSNTSGEYKIQVPKGQFYPIPHLSDNIQGFDPSTGAVLEEKREVNEVVFPNVGYWSTKTIYGKAQKEIEGAFTANLSLKNNQLTGTIQNGFPYDFEELFIWSGNTKFKLGAVKEGETIKVDQKIKQNFLAGPLMLSNAGMHQQTDLEKMKIEKLEYAASSFLLGSMQGKNNQPLIAGITKDSIVDVTLEGKKEKQKNLNLILSPFVAQSDLTGEFTLTNEMLNSKMEVIRGVIHEENVSGSVNEIFMEDGEYEYIHQFPEQLKGKQVEITSLNLKINNQFTQYSILNRETGEYFEINPDQKSVTLNKDSQVNQYFSKEGELLIRINKSGNGDPYVILPTITVKGVVAP